MFDYLIVGAGFSGCTIAERIATQLNKKCLIVDKRNHIGGNAYDFYNDDHILIHKYGPHIFHTNSLKVWAYLSQFTEWHTYFHHVQAFVEGKFVPVPFNLNSLNLLFPSNYAKKLEDLLIDTYGYGEKIPILKLKDSADGELQFLAKYIYDNVFYGYTTKMWELKPEELDASVTSRVPVYISRDDRYFQDTFQGIPKYGYTKMFHNMLSSPNIHYALNTDYKDIIDSVKFNKIVYTGPIDSFFDYIHGELPYRSLHFDFNTVERDYEQQVAQLNYPNNHLYTRTTEFKHLSQQKSEKTVIAYEYPQAFNRNINEPYYPIPRPENAELFKKYKKEAEKIHSSTIFCGRLADYQYYNMDQVTARALSVFENTISPNS